MNPELIIAVKGMAEVEPAPTAEVAEPVDNEPSAELVGTMAESNIKRIPQPDGFLTRVG